MAGVSLPEGQPLHKRLAKQWKTTQNKPSPWSPQSAKDVVHTIVQLSKPRKQPFGRPVDSPLTGNSTRDSKSPIAGDELVTRELIRRVFQWRFLIADGDSTGWQAIQDAMGVDAMRAKRKKKKGRGKTAKSKMLRRDSATAHRPQRITTQ